MDIKVKMDKGCFYRNDLWFSPAYQSLSLSSRDLLQCLVTEINKSKVKGKWLSFRNGELSFTESDYTKLTKRSKQTYLNARNQLIETGFIKMTHRGGIAEEIDYVEIMTLGNAKDFGNLAEARSQPGACSNGHGGL